MSKWTVELDWNEMAIASMVGIRRRLSSRMKGSPETTIQKDAWAADIEGAAGEMAFAKLFGLYFGGTVDTFKDIADVGTFEVRTAAGQKHRLIIRDNDDPEAAFVLMVGKAPKFRFAGWIRAKDAFDLEGCRQDLGGHGKPCWAIDQKHLNLTNPTKKPIRLTKDILGI